MTLYKNKIYIVMYQGAIARWNKLNEFNLFVISVRIVLYLCQ